MWRHNPYLLTWLIWRHTSHAYILLTQTPPNSASEPAGPKRKSWNLATLHIHHHYIICNNDDEFVYKFAYLGSIITNTGNLQPGGNRRIGLAAGVMRSQRQPLWCHSPREASTPSSACIRPLRYYLSSYTARGLATISTSLCSRLSAFDMQAEWTNINSKLFDYKYKTNIEVRTLTKRQPIQRYIAQSRLRCFGHQLRLRHSIILPTPSTPSTRGLRDGQDPAEPLARDGATSSPNTSNSWAQHRQKVRTSPSTVRAGGQPLLLVPSLRTPSLQEPYSEWVSECVVKYLFF